MGALFGQDGKLYLPLIHPVQHCPIIITFYIIIIIDGDCFFNFISVLCSGILGQPYSWGG